MKIFLVKDLLSLKSRSAVRWMNLFAFTSVFLGVFAWLLVMAFMDGLQNKSRDQLLSANPHLLWEGGVREDLLSSKEKVKAMLGNDLKSIDYSLQTEGLLERPPSEVMGREIQAVLIQGDEALKRGHMLVGVELSEGLGVYPGDLLELRSVWKMEGNSLGLRVADLFESQVYDIDRRVVKVNQRDLEQWLGYSGAVSRIAIQLKDPFQVDKHKASLSKLIGVPVQTWKEVDSSYWYSLKLERFAMALSMFFVIALASLAVNMALSARVAERGREISLLRALGLNKAQVFRLYLAEGLLIGMSSIILAVISAPFAAKLISSQYKLPNYYYRTELPVYWDKSAVLVLCVSSLLLCLWASWRPAKRAMESAVSAGLRF